MNRDELVDALTTARVDDGALVCIMRRGEEYLWRVATGKEIVPAVGDFPDAWIYFAGSWPTPGVPRGPFLEDLLEEMESMCGGADRCRWPISEPWSHSH